MKILDTVFDYQNGIDSLTRGLCRVRSFINQDKIAILLTNLQGKNDGQSITNVVERIIPSLLKQGLIVAADTVIEHYEREEFYQDQFYSVILSAEEPTWNTLSPSTVLHILGCTENELLVRSEEDKRIIELADTIRFRRNPFVDTVFLGGNDYIARKLAIQAGMVSKQELSNLIERAVGEQEIQSLIKKDLSLLGEVYASPHEEYICFSEFPILNGYVDFVVLSGRSRMCVTLIEIKGAEFNLVNASGYQEFNHKILEATGQIRQRLGVIYRDFNAFRKQIHRARMQAECGKKIHNAFLGPTQEVCVDPNKDIILHTVVIGGRTQNDLAESRKRQDFEHGCFPPVSIESWDTWLRKLQRI